MPKYTVYVILVKTCDIWTLHNQAKNFLNGRKQRIKIGQSYSDYKYQCRIKSPTGFMLWSPAIHPVY